jgi:Holliday junction resolvase
MKAYRKLTPEGMLTRSVRQLLSAAGIFSWKNFGGLGSPVGLPDICACYKGRMIAIELKAPKGKTSPAQDEFIRRINEAGGNAFVARSLDDVIEALNLGERFLIR